MAAVSIRSGSTPTLRTHKPQSVSLQELVDDFKEKRGLSISMLSSGVSLLYASFFPKAKVADRLSMRLSQLVESVSKRAVPAHHKYVIFEIVAEDEEEADAEVPYLKVQVR